ncbi:hypothetical protein GCM10010156_59520 [Planobispora rosea]|uniref:HTH luxR-type domain-containing protein n=1 Tax=Planobispora rosea TaxID=35762 RepID=A0A8J3S5N5_PLARO|nr:LuxR C-terminal-related transcriptional regulator [Planobispora rosea]GGS93364.1 hypothetical protein GCM10010156_59520 [Planobispora rosea]GIH87254.1 hypothetical protein Pro02_56620 [Planobispora rosea]
MCAESGDEDLIGPGLCDEGTRVYVAAVERGRVSKGELTRCLVELGLLHPLSDHSDVWVPLRPSSAVIRLSRPLNDEIKEREEWIHRLHAVLAPLEAVYSATQQRQQHNWLIIHADPRAVEAALEECLSGSREELLLTQLGNGGDAHPLTLTYGQMQPLFRRGVGSRIIYQHAVRFNPRTLEFMRLVSGRGGQVRTLPSVVDRLVIVDREVAFIPADLELRSVLEIQHRGLVRFLADVFERDWWQATPVDVKNFISTSKESMSQLQHAILRLLVEGHTDDAIARRMGLNVRTCRGHIAKISKQLGSNSRAQLGYLIATSGLLSWDTVT